MPARISLLKCALKQYSRFTSRWQLYICASIHGLFFFFPLRTQVGGNCGKNLGSSHNELALNADGILKGPLDVRFLDRLPPAP